MVGEDEQSAPAGTAKHKVDGAFRHVYASYLLTGGVVDENLPIRHVHIAIRINSDTLAARLANGWRSLSVPSSFTSAR